MSTPPNNKPSSFGIPGVTIKPTLSNYYDPYSGINMTIQDSCSHVEVMTLPLGVVSGVEEVICNDPFATNGPIEYGGNGQPGRCYNSGTINCRYVGSHNNSGALQNQIYESDFIGEDSPAPDGPWYDRQNNEYWTNDIWISRAYNAQEQISKFDQYYPDGQYSPFGFGIDWDRNMSEWRTYIRSDETGNHYFCFLHDDGLGLWIDDGDGGPMQQVYSYNAVGTRRTGYSYYLEANKNYRVLLRWFMQTGPEYAYVAMTKPSQGDFNASGVGTCTSGGSGTLDTYLLRPTFVDPPTPAGQEYDFSGGDGVYYNTQDGFFPYVSDDTVGEFLSNVTCDTVITEDLSNFSRMRAVCKDGSYVEIANNGDSENSVLSPTQVFETENNSFVQKYTVIKTVSNTTDDSNSSTSTMSGEFTDPSFINSSDIRIKKIRLLGDFNSSNEYLTTTIGGVNFGNLSSNRQNQSYYNVFNGNQLVEKNEFNQVEYDLFASANVNDAGGYYSYRIEITFEILIEIGGEDVETAFTDFTFFSGRDACDSIAQPNTELYYLSDGDLRPSLGLFALKNYNQSEANFDVDILDFNQSNNTITNRISNGSGRLVSQYDYKQNSLGINSYLPQGSWGYIGLDGIGAPIAHERNNVRASKFIQDSIYQNVLGGGEVSGDVAANLHLQIENGVYGYAGYYPYLYSEATYSNVTTPPIDYDYQWASWQQSDECHSYGRCLRFRASEEFWNNNISLGDTNFDSILNLTTQNQYRTINQFQYLGNVAASGFPSLEISFWMKTMDDEFLDLNELPEVEAGMAKHSSGTDKDFSYTTYDLYQYDAINFDDLTQYYAPFVQYTGYVGSTTYNRGVEGFEDLSSLHTGPYGIIDSTFSYLSGSTFPSLDGQPSPYDFEGSIIYYLFDTGTNGDIRTGLNSNSSLGVPFTNVFGDMSLINVDYEGSSIGYYLLIGSEWMRIVGHQQDTTSDFSSQAGLDWTTYISGAIGGMGGLNSWNGGTMRLTLERGLFGTEIQDHQTGEDVHIFYLNQNLYPPETVTLDTLLGQLNPLFEFYYGELDNDLTDHYDDWKVHEPFGYDRTDNATSNATDQYSNVYNDSLNNEIISPLNICSYKYDDSLRVLATNDNGGNYGYEWYDIDISLGKANFTEIRPGSTFEAHPKILGLDEDERVTGLSPSQYYYYGDIEISPIGCAQHLFEMTIPYMVEKQYTADSGPYINFNPNDYSPNIYQSGPKEGHGIFYSDDFIIFDMGQALHPNDDAYLDISAFQNRTGLSGGPAGTPVKLKGALRGPNNDIVPDLFFNRYIVIHKETSQQLSPDNFYSAPLSTFGDNRTLAYDGIALFNSKTSVSETTSPEDIDSFGFGSMNRFKNNQLNTWEKFTFNFTPRTRLTQGTSGVDGYTNFVVQAGNNFKGTVYLDDFSVKYSGAFTPDCDVRKRKSDGTFGKAELTEYYDKTIQLNEYNDSIAPLEAQFYFYPRFKMDDSLKPSAAKEVIYEDFSKGCFYIFDIDWGDGAPKEFVEEPVQLLDDKILYHTYESAGIYDITGTMFRTPSTTSKSVIHNQRFTLRININEGVDEDFTYFGSDGYSFIPYKNTLPVIGGYSEQSIYYKSIKRNLGLLDGENINTQFNSIGDRLKTELALTKLDNSFNQDLTLIPPFQKRRYTNPGQPDPIGYIALTKENTSIPNSCGGPIDSTSPDITVDTTLAPYSPEQCCTIKFGGVDEYNVIKTGDWPDWINIAPYNYELYECHTAGYSLIYSAQETYPEELGSSFGDTDLLDIRYFNKPKYMWEMLGFEDEETAIPDNSRYWKNWIPEDYSIFNREDVPLQDLPPFNWDGSHFHVSIHANDPTMTGDFSQNRYTCGGASPWWWGGTTMQASAGGTVAGGVVNESNLLQFGKSCCDIMWNSYLEPFGGSSYSSAKTESDWNNYMPDTPWMTEPSFEDIFMVDIDKSHQYYTGNTTALSYIGTRYGEKIAFVCNPSANFDSPGKINTYSQQGWLNNYYYPVLPKYNNKGEFIGEVYPNDNIPYPLDAPITNEYYEDKNLKININVNSIEPNVLNDNSGNNNYGFVFSDYRPDFDSETLQPKKTKPRDLIKTSKHGRSY